jgi:hypothetical protein
MICNSSMNLLFYVNYLCDLCKLTWSAYRFTMSNWTMECWSMSLLIKDIQVIGGIPVIPSQILGNKTFSPIFFQINAIWVCFIVYQDYPLLFDNIKET